MYSQAVRGKGVLTVDVQGCMLKRDCQVKPVQWGSQVLRDVAPGIILLNTARYTNTNITNTYEKYFTFKISVIC